MTQMPGTCRRIVILDVTFITEKALVSYEYLVDV
jgi:hypothetical protein